MANGRLAWDFKGLVTAPGLLARPGASCLQANNWRFPAPGVARKREGFEIVNTLSAYPYSRLVTAPALGASSVYILGSLASAYPGIALAYVAEQVVSGALTALSTAYDEGPGAADGFSVPSAISVGRTSYLVLPRGTVVRKEYSTGAIIVPYAGMPRGAAPLVYSMDAATFTVLTAGTLLANNASRAYRVTWHKRTAGPTSGADDTYELGGPPTARLVIRNIAGTSGFAGATSDVNLRIPIPRTLVLGGGLVTTDWFWRLWASRIETSATATPDDELYLVDEAFLTSTDITNGYASVADNTPDVYLQAQPRLHTNATNFAPLDVGIQNGQANADDRPPSGRCIASFANCMFVGAPVFWPEETFRLITPLTAGESFVVAGYSSTYTFTAVAGAPAAVNQFTAVAGLATAGLILEAQARNIADAVSRTFVSPAGPTQAHHVSLGSDSQGSIRFFDEGSEFWVYSSSAATRAKFRPQLQASTAVPGIRARSVSNAVAFSKQERPDAFPALNLLTVGASSNVVRALLPFRERLLVWTDGGLYAIDGSTFADFTVTPVDLTAKILCYSSAVSLDDRAYAWCTDGIVEYKDGAIRRVSESIAPTLRSIMEVEAGDGSSFPGISVGFAVADPRNHEVQFWYASSASGAAGPRSYKWLAWNTQTECWSTGSMNADSVECWVAHAAVMPLSGRLVALGAKSAYTGATSNDAVLLLQSKGHTTGTPTTSQYSDDAHVAATEYAVQADLRLQWALADVDARVHWQRAVFEFESGEQSFLLKPTALSLVFSADAQASNSASIAIAPTTPLVEVEVPDGYRRATRSALVLTHSAKEPCGLIAAKQTFADGGSRFPG